MGTSGSIAAIARRISGTMAAAAPDTRMCVRESCDQLLVRSCCQKFRYAIGTAVSRALTHCMSLTRPTTSQRVGPIITVLPTRAAIGPQAARQRLVHQDHARTGRRVAVVELAPGDQAGAERLEVARAHEGRCHEKRVSRIAGVAGESSGIVGLFHPGSGGTPAGLAATTTGQRLEPADHFALEIPGAIVRVPDQARPQPHQDERIRIEAGPALQEEEAAHEKAAAAEEHDGQRHLHDDQAFAQPRTARAGAGRLLLHRTHRVRPRRLKRRRDAGQHAGEDGHADARQHDAQVEREIEIDRDASG